MNYVLKLIVSVIPLSCGVSAGRHDEENKPRSNESREWADSAQDSVPAAILAQVIAGPFLAAASRLRGEQVAPKGSRVIFGGQIVSYIQVIHHFAAADSSTGIFSPSSAYEHPDEAGVMRIMANPDSVLNYVAPVGKELESADRAMRTWLDTSKTLGAIVQPLSYGWRRGRGNRCAPKLTSALAGQ